MDKQKIELEDLKEELNRCLIKLNRGLLQSLLVKASKSNKPWKNRKFAISLGYRFNRKYGKAGGIEGLYRYNKALKFETLAKLIKVSKLSWKSVEKNLISIRYGRHDGEVKINFPIKIEPRLGTIVGHILGDGSIDKKYSQVFYTNKNIDLVKEFVKCMKIIFNIEPRIWLQKSGNFKKSSKWIKKLDSLEKAPLNSQIGIFYPKICGIILYFILGKFAFGHKKKITKEILNANSEFQSALIRAFYDDEGHVDSSNSIRIWQKNLKLLIDIKLMLNNLGIKSSPIRHYRKRGNKHYFFNISSYSEFVKFIELIGFTSVNKNNNLKNLITEMKFRNHFNLRK